MATTYSDRWQQMSGQHAYERRIAAGELAALLEPYCGHVGRFVVPAQRRPVEAYDRATSRTTH